MAAVNSLPSINILCLSFAESYPYKTTHSTAPLTVVALNPFAGTPQLSVMVGATTVTAASQDPASVVCV